MNFSQVDFYAQDEEVEIIPSFSSDEIELLQGTYGPFEVNLPTSVPIWVAMTLRKRSKCKIQQPTWLTVDHLVKLNSNEKDDSELLSPLPYYFFANSLLLLSVATRNGSDFVKPDSIRLLIEDLLHIRDQKIQKALSKLNSRTVGLDLSNHSSVEVTKYKEIVEKILGILDKMV